MAINITCQIRNPKFGILSSYQSTGSPERLLNISSNSIIIKKRDAQVSTSSTDIKLNKEIVWELYKMTVHTLQYHE